MLIIRTPNDLGKVIKQTRTDQKLTQLDLAALSNVGVRFIVDLEKGKNTSEIGKALNVLRMLGITLAIEEDSQYE